MRNEQLSEANLRTIIDRLHATQSDQSLRLFVLRDNILYRCDTNPDGPELLLFVPMTLRSTLLQ